MLSEKEAANIRRFVEAGGLFVTSFRLGVKDESSQIVRTPLPGLLRDVMGVTVKDYVPIYSEKTGVKFSSQLAGPDGECAMWADRLQPSSASVLATYTGPYAGDAAITINSFGKGKAVYVGADLDPASLGRVLAALLEPMGVSSMLKTPRGVEITRRKAGDKEWMFLLNHNAASQEVSLPGPLKDLLTGATHNEKTSVEPYGVMVLQKA
jgi:beta-galactosidase